MFRRSSNLPLIVLLAFALPLGSKVLAGDGLSVCQHCGCHRTCNQVCRLINDEKKVTIVCWGSQCEDVCLPGKSCRGCLNCEQVCQADENSTGQEPCSTSKNFLWYDWTPGCSTGIHTKKKLMKKTIEKKLPSYKWVVEDLCQECEDNCVATLIEPGYVVPLPPESKARLVYGVQQASMETEPPPTGAATKRVASPGSSFWPTWLWKPAGLDPK